MNDLTVDPAALSGIASQYATQAGVLQSQLDLIIAANDNIAGSWISSQATTYTTKITEQQDAIQKMIDTLNDLSTTMSSIATTYKNIDDEIAASLGTASN